MPSWLIDEIEKLDRVETLAVIEYLIDKLIAGTYKPSQKELDSLV